MERNLGPDRTTELVRYYDNPEFFYRTEEAGSTVPDRTALRISPHPLGASDPKRFVAEVKATVRKTVAAKVAQVRAEGGRASPVVPRS